MKEHRFAGARTRVAPNAKTRKRAKHSLFAVSAIAALVGGGALAAVSAVDVTPSAASIPARETLALDLPADSVTVIEAAPKKIVHAALTDGIRLTTTARKLRALGSSALSGFLLSSSVEPESNRFLPSEVMSDDADGFHPVLLASLETSMDGERFADANGLENGPGLSFFDRLTLGEIAVGDLAPLAPAETAVAVLEVEPEERPAREQTPEAPQAEAEKPDPATTELAYAAPDEDEEEEKPNAFLGGFKKLFVNPMGLPGPGSGIAVYDIRNAVVYMPNGQRLEAHSGLGKMQDNPKYAHVKMKGPTPPNIYNLRMREALFHGVEAVRMLPTDHDKMRGRNGILAHTYMLGKTKSSNGCLSFSKYDKFLTAFKRGEVTKIIVVPDLTHLPTYMAQLDDSSKVASTESPRPIVQRVNYNSR